MIFSKDYSHLLLIPEGKEGAVTIPGSTKFIPAQALSLCHLGSSLSAGDGSTNFTTHDRMLFSKDMKTLVAVPPAYGTSVVLPTETEVIGEYALAGCKDLASITVLGNVHSIDPTAFADEVKAFAVVALPAGEDYKVRKAVWEAAGFQHFAEPAQPGTTTSPNANEASGLTYTLLDDYTLAVSWQGKDDPEANLEVPASAEINGVPYRVSTIAENAFANRGSLTSVKLPTTITTISTAAFAGCANLSIIEFPNTLHTIGERAFEATSIKDLCLPTSINSIGSRAYASCSTLERVIALGTSEVASDALAGCTNVSIYVPSGSEDTWNPGLPSDNNHLMPYGVSLSEEPLTIEVGQEANLLEGGNLQAPDPIEASYSYAAAPLSVDAGTVSAKKEGTSDVTAVLTLDDVELTRAIRTVEVSPNPEAEANITQLSSEVALPGVYLSEASDIQISVDAPFAVTFGADKPYDVAENKAAAASIEAPASFRNNMDLPVQLAKVDCSIDGIANYLTPINNDFPLSKQKLFSLYPEGKVGKAVHFGYYDKLNSVVPDDRGAFVIQPNSLSSYIFRLNLTNDTTLANAKVNPSIADGGITSRSLVSVMCTFEHLSFYLKDNEGNFYTLADVKEHANSIAESGEDSPYWNQYNDYLNKENSYTCQTIWGGTPYDVRIIGINHDELASSSSKAGLTFQFKNLLNEKYPMNTSGIDAGSWGVSELRARMNQGGDIWSMVPADLQRQIATDKKYYGSDCTSTSAEVSTSKDQLFLASYFELTGSVWSGWSSRLWLANEGTQYEYWNGKVTNDYSDNAALEKGFQSTPPSKGVFWWERSANPSNSMTFLRVSDGGDPSDYNNANASWGICPCFCL